MTKIEIEEVNYALYNEELELFMTHDEPGYSPEFCSGELPFLFETIEKARSVLYHFDYMPLHIRKVTKKVVLEIEDEPLKNV